MTLYGATDPQVIGQPISPFFGAQQNVRYPGAPVVQLPSGVPVVVVESNGSMPANQLVNTVNGISVGGQGIGGDPCSLAELLTNGNGVPAMGGVPVSPSGAAQDQQFTVGFGVPTAQENGPTTTNTDPLPLAPVSRGTLCQNIGLQTGGFTG